ncbi:MAG: M12 family metallo-peptidase [Planctomycetota bacterium]
MRHLSPRLACVSAVVLTICPADRPCAAQGGAFQAAVLQGLELSSARIQPLVFAENPVSGVLHTTVSPAEGVFWTLELERHSLRSDRFAVWVDDGSHLTRVPAPPIVTWKGRVLETGDAVRASFDGTAMRAIIFGAANSWTVQPVSDAGVVSPTPSLHALYDAGDIAVPQYECGVVNDFTIGGDPGEGGAQPFGTGLKICDLAVDADFDFYVDNGQSVGATVQNIETVMNAVENVYEASVSITYELTTVVVRTTAGTPYTTSNAGALLGQFASVWNSAPFTNIRGDLSHLFTGRNLSGSTIGIASLSVVCSADNQYGLSETSFSTNFNSRVALTAHELGHNWSAPHCNGINPCRIMCSGLGGCNGINPLSFAPVPAAQIAAFRDSRTCLSDLALPLTLPFQDEFENNNVATSNWVYVQGAFVSTAAIGEPSGTRSLNLDSAGPEDYRDDEVRSNFIALGGVFQPTLTYQTEHVGVEAGEQLVVEYWASNRVWVELNRITSNGVDQTAFVLHSHNLTGTALHNEFRIRFRTEGDGLSDDWFIDSVNVTEGIFIPDPPSISSVSPAISNIEGGITVSVLGDDLAPEAIVTVGSIPLISQTFVNATQIVGVIPPTLSGGFEDVTVTQSSGTSTLTNGFRYVDDKIIVESKDVVPGQANVNINVTMDNESPIAGYSYGLEVNPAALQIADVTLNGTLAANSWFVYTSIDNSAAGGWFVIGVVFDQNIQVVIPPGTNQLITRFAVDVDASVTPGELLELQVRDDLSDPVVDLTFGLSDGSALRPARISGFLSAVAGASFVRGDANATGSVDISDAVLTLGYLFAGDSVSCLDALDVADDGQVNIGDAISLLSYLFSGGTAPAAPFPAAGIDPTPDAIDCVPAP